jgi:hypothetical protein
MLLADQAAAERVDDRQPMRQRCEPQGRSEHRGGDRLLGVAVEQLGRERDEHDERKEREVEGHQARVERAQGLEQAVVDDPEAADEGEREQVGDRSTQWS